MNEANFNQIKNTFDSILWHDSVLQSISISKAQDAFSVVLSVQLFEKDVSGELSLTGRTVVFESVRIFCGNLDLLGVLRTGGMLASAISDVDAVGFEKKSRNRLKDFDLKEDSLPLSDCLAFRFRMIHPGGEFTIYSRGFRVL